MDIETVILEAEALGNKLNPIELEEFPCSKCGGRHRAQHYGPSSAGKMLRSLAGELRGLRLRVGLDYIDESLVAHGATKKQIIETAKAWATPMLSHDDAVARDFADSVIGLCGMLS